MALLLTLGGVASAATPARKPLALGVSIPDGTSLAALDAFQASIGGQRVATWTIWRSWGWPTTADFPTALANGVRARGAVPILWWEPVGKAPDATFKRNLDIANGLHDAYIRRFAADAKAYGGTVLVRFAHQANANYTPWGWDYSATDDNTRATFIAMWRHVVGVFRDVGAKNVKFVWTIATQTCNGNCLTRPLGYPGDAWVDYTGFTWENWGQATPDSAVPTQPTISMLDGYTPVVNRLQRVTRKPVIAVATASSEDGGIKAQWIRDGYPAVYKHLPALVAICWLDADLSGPPHLHRDWSLSGDALDAYADIAADARFQGRIKPWWKP